MQEYLSIGKGRDSAGKKKRSFLKKFHSVVWTTYYVLPVQYDRAMGKPHQPTSWATNRRYDYVLYQWKL